VLRVTRSEGLVKLRALAKLCSENFFQDPSLFVVAWRRIFEVLELAMPPVVERKYEDRRSRGNRRTTRGSWRFWTLMRSWGEACGWIGDGGDARRYLKRAKEGYEEQLGRDSEKAFKQRGILTRYLVRLRLS